MLKIDGEVGNKKAYDPRAWGKSAEEGMAKRVVEACEDLRSTGTTLAEVIRTIARFPRWGPGVRSVVMVPDFGTIDRCLVAC